MKYTYFLLSLIFLLNGCAESIALLGSSLGGASNGKVIQSSLQSTVSLGIKKQTGKSPLGHAISYTEKNNPEKEKERCVSFIDKTNSEFCSAVKKQITLANIAIKEKTFEISKKSTNTFIPTVAKVTTKFKDKFVTKSKNLYDGFTQPKKSPRELAIAVQFKMKNSKKKPLK